MNKSKFCCDHWIIWTAGRFQADFEAKCTETNIMFQNGSNFDDEYLAVVPDDKSGAVGDVKCLKTLPETLMVKWKFFEPSRTNTTALSTWPTTRLCWHIRHCKMWQGIPCSVGLWSLRRWRPCCLCSATTLRLVSASDLRFKFFFPNGKLNTAISEIINNLSSFLRELVTTLSVRVYVNVKNYYVETWLIRALE